MTQPRPAPSSLRARIANRLASVKFAVVLVGVILLACAAGTLLPQGADVPRYLAQHPTATGRMELLGQLGLTDVYSSWWFLGLLGLLGASVAACSTRRLATVRRTSGSAQRRALGSMLTHISILLILAGGVIRGVWGEKGYLEFHEGETRAKFAARSGAKALPFAVQLARFEIETYASPSSLVDSEGSEGGSTLLVTWAEQEVQASFPVELDAEHVVGPPGETLAPENSFRVKILRYVPDFVVDTVTREVTSRSPEPRNPAILVAVNGPNYSNHRWLFAKYPNFQMRTDPAPHGETNPLQMVYQDSGAVADRAAWEGPVKQFRSTLRIIENGEVIQERAVQVNRPLTYQGYTFYQTGYNPEDLTYTSLQVVKDPGVPVVYAGFGLMIVGLFIVFYLNPWLEARRETP